MVVTSEWMYPEERTDEKREERESVDDRQAHLLLFSKSIRSSVSLFYWRTLWFGGPVSKVSRLFGPSLMIAVYKQPIPQSGPRAQKPKAKTETRPATLHRATYRWL